MTPRSHLAGKLTIRQVQKLALDDATEHFFETALFYTDLFLDNSRVPKADEEEERLRDMIHARGYLFDVLARQR